jgi:cation diffusion facilitator CzcD-associated flavoprotein CzcO
VVKATGILNKWKWPEIPGLHDFEGKLVHTARYDTSFDARGKSIAVIGTGSTGIQLVPALQPIADNIAIYSRSRAWVSPRGPYAAEIEKRGGNENCRSL